MTRMVLLSGLAACLAWSVSVRADDKPADKGKPDPKPIIIQIDGSKLPPDVLKRLLDLAQQGKEPADKKPEEKKGPPSVPPGLAKKPGPKPESKPEAGKKPELKSISLTEAIAIAEKAGKGTAVKAERKGEDGDVHFKIDVVGKDGQKQKVELDTGGKVRPNVEEKKSDEKKPEEKKKPGKGKKKKDNDDDDDDD